MYDRTVGFALYYKQGSMIFSIFGNIRTVNWGEGEKKQIFLLISPNGGLFFERIVKNKRKFQKPLDKSVGWCII